MADDKLSVNPEGLLPASSNMDTVGERLAQITQNLVAKLNELGTPWGDDKNGAKFFEQYGGVRDDMLKGASDMAAVVRGTAHGIHTMADNFKKMEERNAEIAARVKQGLESSGGGSDYGPRVGTVYGTGDGSVAASAPVRSGSVAASVPVRGGEVAASVPVHDGNSEDAPSEAAEISRPVGKPGPRIGTVVAPDGADAVASQMTHPATESRPSQARIGLAGAPTGIAALEPER